MLYHLTNALKDEALKVARHEFGDSVPDISPLNGSSEEPHSRPFTYSFRLRTFSERGVATYIVTVNEVMG
jgi:hypothetical protein